ncbi:hypothetical protein E4U58_006511 [Claviceps cyperi]|nr:hypothetical protein E4U58_006511 [Claviceps cyperi]
MHFRLFRSSNRDKRSAGPEEHRAGYDDYGMSNDKQWARKYLLDPLTAPEPNQEWPSLLQRQTQPQWRSPSSSLPPANRDTHQRDMRDGLQKVHNRLLDIKQRHRRSSSSRNIQAQSLRGYLRGYTNNINTDDSCVCAKTNCRNTLYRSSNNRSSNNRSSNNRSSNNRSSNSRSSNSRRSNNRISSNRSSNNRSSNNRSSNNRISSNRSSNNRISSNRISSNRSSSNRNSSNRSSNNRNISNKNSSYRNVSYRNINHRSANSANPGSHASSYPRDVRYNISPSRGSSLRHSHRAAIRTEDFNPTNPYYRASTSSSSSCSRDSARSSSSNYGPRRPSRQSASSSSSSYYTRSSSYSRRRSSADTALTPSPSSLYSGPGGSLDLGPYPAHLTNPRLHKPAVQRRRRPAGGEAPALAAAFSWEGRICEQLQKARLLRPQHV